MNKGKIGTLCVSILSLLSVTGCSVASTAASQPTAATVDKPVTLTLDAYNVTLTDAEFQQFFAEPLKKAYPNITLKLIQSSSKTNTPKDLISTGQTPDLVYTSNGWINDWDSLGYPLNLDSLIATNKFDLNRFEPQTIAAIKQFGKQGEMYAIPLAMNYRALFYNRDIFDHFNLPYPKDNMNWSQVLDLARQLTKVSDGKQYIGLDPDFADNLANPMTLPRIDPKTGKAMIDIPQYHTVFNFLQEDYSLPGYLGKDNQYRYGRDAFIKDQDLAMMPDWGLGIVGPLEQAAQQGFHLNWDVVSLPNFSGEEGRGSAVDEHLLMISSQSKHADAAFDVIKTLTSNSVQTIINQSGWLTALTDPEVKKSYGANLKSFQGKNTNGILIMKPQPLNAATPFDGLVSQAIRNAQQQLAHGTDVNTVLRNAQEQADKQIQQQKQEQ